MHLTEQELVEATNFDTQREYKHRQDYLVELLIASADLSQDAFDSLSEAAYGWTNAAAVARKSGKTLPDFVEEGEYEDHSEDDPSSDLQSTSETGDLVNVQEQPSSKPRRAGKKGGRKSKKEPKQPQSTEIDAFGIRVDTKAHLAVKLMEVGCTMKEVHDATGSTHYNIIRRLEKQGHHVHRNGHFIKVTAKGGLNVI